MAMELFQIFGRIGLNGVDNVNRQLGNTTRNANNSSNKIVSALKKIGTAVGTYFAVDKIKKFGEACVSAASDVAAENAAFLQIMGDYATEAQEKLDKVSSDTGITSTRMTGYMTSLSAKFKGLGFGVEDATSLAARGLELAADGAAFWDMSLDESTSHLNSFINGSYEGGEAIGLFANDTQMAMYAVQQGVISGTKEWANLDEATKQATRLEYAENMYTLSGATGQAAKESEAYLNVQGELSEAWRQFKATIGEPILENFVIPAMQKLSNDVIPFLQEKIIVLIEWIKEAYAWYKENETVINAVAVAVGVFVAALGTMQLIETVKTWIEKMKIAMVALNAAMAANVITIVIAAIAALVAAFVYLWNNCEDFRNFWIGLWEDIKVIANNVGEWFKTAWSDISAWFQDAWNSVSEWFNGAVNSVTEWFKGAWQDVSDFFTELWNGINEKVTDATNSINEIINSVFNAISEFINTVWTGISDAISAAWDWISEKVTSAVNAVSETVTSVFNAISEFINTVWGNIKTTISTTWENIKTSVTRAVNSVRSKVQEVFNSVKEKVTTVWNNIKTAITNPIESAKTSVTRTVNSIRSKIGEVFESVKTKVTTVWNNIKTAIKEPIEGARDLVKGAIDSIKGFFNFEFKWPKLKLPHFSFTGSWNPFDWPDKFPKLGVEWYAKGGILNSPTLFGISPTGKAMVGGEAGAEAVAPIDTLMSYVSDAVKNETDNLNYNIQKLISMLSDYMPQIVNGIDRPLVLDTGAIVGGIAKNMDGKLGDINRMKGRGN